MAKKPVLEVTLRALVYREGAVWLAHCLEMDIVAEGKTPEEASVDLVDLCNLRIKVALEDGDLNSVFRAAPSEYWKMFFMSAEKPQKAVFKSEGKMPKRLASKGRHLPASQSSHRIKRIETRELELV